MSLDNLNVGYSYTAVSGGVGTTAVTTRSGVFARVIIPGTYVGTINFHDSDSATGTTTTSQIFSLGLPTTSVASSIEVGVGFRKGLLYQATGTPVVTIVWG